MAEGIRLGGAYYELTADSAGLVRALSQAEQQSKRSVQAISQATGIAERDVQRLANTYIAAEKRRADAAAASTLKIIKAHNDAADAAEKSAAAQTKASAQTSASFANVIKGAVGFTAAAAGVTTGAVAINQAMNSIAESTQRAAQAQFALNALYGKTAPIITKQAEDLAKTAGRSRTEALEASTAVANLGRQYALTFEQQQKVLQISANLAAVRGISLEESTKRISDALRGEAEAAEYLGQVLNSDAVKAFAKMTDEQRKNFETLSPLTKAQIVFGKLTEDNADLMSKAAERAGSSVGAFDKLRASIDNLSVSIGKVFAPATSQAALALASLVEQADKFAQSDLVKTTALVGRLTSEMASNILTAKNAYEALLGVFGATARVGAEGRIQIGPDSGLPGAGPGPTPDQAKAAEEARRARERQQAEEQDRIKTFVEQQKRAIDRISDAEEQRYRKDAELRDKAIEAEKTRLEVERGLRLKASEDAERAAIRSIEAQQKAEEQRFEQAIDHAEQEKKLRLELAEATAEAAKKAIDVEKDRLDSVRELEDRARDDERRSEDRSTEDARRVEDRVRDAAQKREIDRLEDLRDARVKAIEDEIEAYERGTEKKLRALDREADKARQNADAAIRRIERQADREDERHRKALRALDDEKDARLDILDAQLKALDAQERAEDSARRTADLQRRLSDAQRAATRARGTGTPAQIAEARGDLTRAIRVGDEVSIANARERLVQLAGQGAEAIRKADEDLAKAQEDLRAEGVESQRDAERDKLNAAKDAISDEIDARKRAEDDQNRRRKASLDKDKDAERDRLKASLDRIEKQKRAAQDQAKDEERRLRDQLDAVKADAEEQIQVARDRFDAETDILNDRRREEDRFRDDQRLAQDRFREDERKAQDQALADQLDAINASLAQERKDVEAHYNGPNGVITQLRAAMEASKEEYRLRLQAIQDHYRDEQAAIKETYRNDAKTGLLDLQDQAAENNREKLADQLAALASWNEQTKQRIDDQKASWKTLEEAINDVTKAIRNVPSGRIQPPGGVGPVAPPGYGGQPGSRDEDGPGANPPPAVQPTPGPGIGDDSDEVDVDPGRFGVAFGFNQPYSNPFNPAIPNHRGVDLVISGARNNGRGMPVGAFRRGVVVAATIDPNGGNGIIIQADDGLYDRYFHFDEINVRQGETVKRGQRIGILGASGTEGFPHLHYEVSKGINGDPQDRLIDPRPYMRGRDSGYLFQHPTITYTPATREWNQIAERRPERLLGGALTAALGPAPASSYAAMGSFMDAAHPGGGGGYVDSSSINVYGAGTEDVLAKLRREQRSKSLLRGVRSIRSW